MYTQFFGNYLLGQGYVTQEQLLFAMKKQAGTRMKLGTLAIHAGYMTPEEVDRTVIEQTHQDKKFGEIAIEFGFLTSEQVLELLRTQGPDFLLLGQIFVDEGILTNADLATIIADYRSKNEMIDLEMTIDNRKAIDKLFDNFFIASETPITPLEQMYSELLFNNFVRFIGDDYTPLSVVECDSFPIERCVKQQVNGAYSIVSYINMSEKVAIEFASRYVGETFETYDEYVQASMEDFLNLHNGLFIVNVSNEESLELTITAPEIVTDSSLIFDTRTYDFPVMYSFGIVHFIIQILKTKNS